MPRCPHPRRSQQGVFAAAVALLLVPLLGLVTLVVDAGRLYVNKTELQNAADACALAAAQSLTPTASAFFEANTAGLLAAQGHAVDFQRSPLHVRHILIEYGMSATTGDWRPRGGAPAPIAAMKYARCTVEHEGVEIWFMRVTGVKSFKLKAQAIAWGANTTDNCGLTLLPGAAANTRCTKTAGLVQ